MAACSHRGRHRDTLAALLPFCSAGKLPRRHGDKAQIIDQLIPSSTKHSTQRRFPSHGGAYVCLPPCVSLWRAASRRLAASSAILSSEGFSSSSSCFCLDRAALLARASVACRGQILHISLLVQATCADSALALVAITSPSCTSSKTCVENIQGKRRNCCAATATQPAPKPDHTIS